MSSKKQYDLVLAGGRVLCPAGGIDRIMDVAVSDGAIAELGAGLDGREVVGCAGKLVTPGFIDSHAHCYTSTPGAVEIDAAGVYSGVTTLVDGGSSGYMTWDDFLKRDLTGAITDAYAYLNHHPAGHAIMPEPWSRNRFRMRRERLTETIKSHPGLILGVKDRAVGSFIAGAGIRGVEEAREICAECGVPYVVHFGLDAADDMPDRELDAFTGDLLNMLAAGDIITHFCTGKRGGVIRADGMFDKHLRAARERGVIFDCCCGITNFSAQTFRIGRERGFLPDTVSSDLTIGAIKGPARNMGVILSRFLALGAELRQAIGWVTDRAAAAIGMADRKGSLAVGRRADITVSEIQTGDYVFLDRLHGEKFAGHELIVPKQTFLAGKKHAVVHSGEPTFFE